MPILNYFVTFNLSTTEIVLALGLIVLIILNFFLWHSILKIKRTYNSLALASQSSDWPKLFLQEANEITGIKGDINQLRKENQETRQLLTFTLQKVAVIRFNPFKDVGGNQSFVIALLDEKGSGVVISSLYAREETRIYAKPVKNGKSSFQLSQEEQQAIDEAMEES